MTPAQRQQARIAANMEPAKPHPELGNGILFTPKDANHTGSIKYGEKGFCLLLGEALADGGVQVNDRTLADGLRRLNLHSETHL